MKAFLPFIALTFLFMIGCERDELPFSGEGLSMTIGGKVVLTAKDIDYYDLSTHFIYLRGNNSFLGEKLFTDSFQIYANKEKIYTGVFFPIYLSSFPLGHFIETPVIFYENYLFPIGFGQNIDRSGKVLTDLRSDPRIIQALNSHNQLHVGLQCEIRSVQFNPGNQVKLELELTNDDSFNYYHLDPEKMGMGLFHYFTNGPTLWDQAQRKSLTHHTQHIQPEPSDSWEMDWLSLIRSHEKKTIWITYNNFDLVTTGQYKLFFRFPGLSHVDKADLVQRNGRIWLGALDLTKDIQIR